MRVAYMGGRATPKDRMEFQRALDFARASGGVLITTHYVPDPDALGGAYALKAYLASQGILADIVGSGLIHTTADMIRRLGIVVRPWPDILSGDNRPLAIIDTNSPALLDGASKRENRRFLLIDHHTPSDPSIVADVMITDVRAISACEILASLLPADCIAPDMALALAIGIAGDSERLKHADLESLTIFEHLLARANVSKIEVDTLAYPPWKPELALKLLEEAGKVEKSIYRGRLITIGFSELGNPAVLATALRSFDAAIVVVLKPTSDESFKASFRVALEDSYVRGIHANEIARLSSERCGSSGGGGHIDKAGATLFGTRNQVLSAIKAVIMETVDRAEDGKGKANHLK